MKAQPLVNAFRHAFNGIAIFFRNDRNGRIHLAAALIVILAGLFLHVSVAEWCVLLLCNALVISLEMINHALENVCDIIQREFHPSVKTAKDVAAGAVFWSAIISAVIGLVIFVPKIYMLL